MRTKKLLDGLACCAIAFPAFVFAQEEINCEIPANKELEECSSVDEIVVTGSYLKRNKEDFSSPIEVITAIEIQSAGNATLGQYVRDLTFTTNTDTVANVLAMQDGQQDSNSARFNLRGLGVDSTLTLYNGERVIDSGNIGGIVPDIALGRIDVVMDGGSSLYGSDAVAGVVNLMSIQKYDGFKVRSFYNYADGFEQPKLEMLAGHSFDNNIDIVGAISWDKKTTLSVAERPDYLLAYDDDTTGANPGTWATANNVFGSSRLDPSCGTFNGPNPDPTEPGAYPSGYETRIVSGTTPNVPRCANEYAAYQDVARAGENLVGYLNVHWEASEHLDLNFETNITRRKSDFRRSVNTQGRAVMVPGTPTSLGDDPAHPANPFPSTFFPANRIDVWSRAWVPFGSHGTLPSHLEGGAYFQPYFYDTDRFSLKAEYDFGSTSWSGATTVSHQTTSTEIESYDISYSRLQNSLLGLGGPNCTGTTPGANGCEWFNPFGSADPRSPFYQAGVTDNSQELVDWLFVKEKFETLAEELNYFQTYVTGDILELPAGPASMVLGYQRRKSETLDNGSTLSKLGDDYLTSTARIDVEYEQTVDAVFTEFAVPLTDRWTVDASARHEQYDEVDLKTTAPKVGTRFELTDTITLRASWAKSFVAPRGNQLAVVQPDRCVNLQLTSDPLQDTVLGVGGVNNGIQGVTCPFGNPALEEQESTIRNFGIAWTPTDTFSINLDYQRLIYDGRIVSLTAQDTIDKDASAFAAAVASGLLTDTHSVGTANPDGTGAINPTPDGEINAVDWANSGLGDPFVARNPYNGGVLLIGSHPENATKQAINSWDLRIRNGIDLGSYGYFAQVFSVTAYDKYEYEDFEGNVDDAVGQRNADTNLASPIPRYKANLNLSWLGDNQSAVVSVRYLDNIKFDGDTDSLGEPDNMPVDPTIPTAMAAPDNLPSYTTVDFRYGRTFEEVLGGRWDLAFGIKNIFDKMPERLPIVGGFETRLYDNFGRQYYVDMTYEFQ